jgi:hydroxymethylpyrimidine pyrophosphatase-like HAD family hydrolase
MARLARLARRGRALEILLVADDHDGPSAERYGYVNRTITDEQLDREVDAMAERLARFDHEAIARTKAHVDRATLPPEAVNDLSAWCAEGGWRVSVQGRRVYCVPEPLTKSSAVAEVTRRAGCNRVLAAGDSLLDAELLESADAGVRPAHGELHEIAWRRPHVAVTGSRGVLAGEEILRRLLGHVLGEVRNPASTRRPDEIVSALEEGERTHV